VSVFIALAVRAVAILVIFRIGLVVLSTGQVSFWQALEIAAMLLLMNFDMSAKANGNIKF
jgi:hypothetical protein